MRMIKVAELVEDFDLYPRDRVSTYHVNEIAEALRNDSKMPPIRIDKKTKAVIDGFHRRRAYIAVFGESHEIEVIEKQYKSRAAAFEDALRLNADHGLRLDTHDKMTALIKGEKLGVDISAIGEILHWDVDKLAKLKLGRTAKANGESLALKRTIRHKAGDKLNARQKQANEKLSGMNQVFYVNQLIELIESDLLDVNNEVLMERIGRLSTLLATLPELQST